MLCLDCSNVLCVSVLRPTFLFLCFGAPCRALIFFVGCSIPINFLRASPRVSSVCLLCAPPELFFTHCGSSPRLLFPLDFCCVFIFSLVDSIQVFPSRFHFSLTGFVLHRCFDPSVRLGQVLPSFARRSIDSSFMVSVWLLSVVTLLLCESTSLFV
jgi:hypothetical protein